MTLFDIDYRLKALEEMGVDIETGEIIDDEEAFNKAYAEIQMDLQTKIENTACFIKSLKAEAEAIKAEEAKLAQRRKAKEKLAERLSGRIDNFVNGQFSDEEGNVDLTKKNGYKFETAKVKISYRASEKVDVFNPALIPAEFTKVETVVKQDKTAIKKAIKAGEKVEGATLIKTVNMQLK